MSDPHKRLDDAMNQRRLELGLQWRDLAAAAGISYEALRAIRRGTSRPADLTARKLEEALRWEPGSVRAALAGRAPAVREPDPDSPPAPGLSPGEALRHVISASAERLGVGADDLESIFQAVRRDLAQAEAARQAGPDDTPPYGTPDLSVMVLEARLAAGLTLEAVAELTAEAPGAAAGLDVGWLGRLERAALSPDEFPEYPQLDALAYALHLDPARVQEAAGVQYMNVRSVWSGDGQSRAVGVGPVSDEDRQKLENLMQMYRRTPKK
ncbi:helix-turn-helix transcriptional regulator [Streptomyces sp.]|uniref:helix-turn-helix transcriptional regulator n=1 Tax=Streptomyces sp. TaxID=1931 RepID=UPI002810DE36|nr:helix-turn-helix transcriptional regulator [Streptomyces sp.]